MNLYEAIAALDKSQKTIAAVVLSGSRAGETALFRTAGADTELSVSIPYLQTSSAGALAEHLHPFLPVHAREICRIKRSGIAEIGGESVFCEILGAARSLVICGAGHVSMPVIALGKMTGMHVTCIDDRADFADHARQAGADTVICEPFSKALAGLDADRDTFFVIVTRGHRWDKECLLQIFKKEYAYVGMMGSRRRVALLKEDLKREGITQEQLDDLHAPIGLSIGAETPQEIAISIFAEMIDTDKRAQRSFGYPKELLSALLEQNGQSKVLATIISKRGSAPRSVGTKMLIREDGSCAATIGGGCQEMYVTEQALQMIREGASSPRIIEVDMTPETASEEGMVCGGTVQVLLQPVQV